ncbi:MAG: hypothetical protein ACO3SJ_06795, partial [Phycisphaerales bacterium]
MPDPAPARSPRRRPRRAGQGAQPGATPRPHRSPLARLPGIGRFVSSFHPRTLPPMLRANYARELLS